MLHLHLTVNVGAEPVKEFAKLGDGKLLQLALKWGPLLLSLLGIKLPADAHEEGVKVSAVQ